MADGIGALKDSAVCLSVYLLPDDHRRLKILAAIEETSIQSLVMDGIDAIFERRGEAPVGRWVQRRRPR